MGRYQLPGHLARPEALDSWLSACPRVKRLYRQAAPHPHTVAGFSSAGRLTNPPGTPHMTSTYNRTEFLTWDDLTKEQRIDVLHEDYDICDLALAEADTYAVIQREGQDGTPTAEALPLSFFMRSDRNPALGIYSTSAFDGFYLYIGRTGNEGVIAHRHF